MNTPLENIIRNELLVHDAESPPDQRLDPVAIEWFTRNWTEYVRLAAYKMVRGQREHGGNFLTDVDHLEEASNEAVDLINYLGAARHKFIRGSHV